MTSKPVNYLIFLKKWVGFIQNFPQIMWIKGVFDHGQVALLHPLIISKMEGSKARDYNCLTALTTPSKQNGFSGLKVLC